MRLRTKLFQSYLRQEIGFFDTHESGKLLSRLSHDTQIMSSTVANNIPQCVGAVVKFSQSPCSLFPSLVAVLLSSRYFGDDGQTQSPSHCCLSGRCTSDSHRGEGQWQCPSTYLGESSRSFRRGIGNSRRSHSDDSYCAKFRQWRRRIETIRRYPSSSIQSITDPSSSLCRTEMVRRSKADWKRLIKSYSMVNLV